jgi:peptidoglycan/xylan/chitin deacetylase (PgdA/CDA1 family)
VIRLALPRALTAVRRRFRTMAFARTVPMRNRSAIVSFTFDDFPKSAVSNGARLLEDFGVRGTFYATGSYCGRVVDDIPQYGVEDLAALARAGHEIGCHTFTHVRVSTLSRASLNREIDLNAAFLAGQLSQIDLRSFAYPFGDLSFAATMQLQSRFTACRSSQPGLNIGVADLGRLQSVRLYDRLIGRQDIFKLIRQAATNNAWLIFYTHDVSDRPSNFGCTPGLLKHAVEAASEAHLGILTIDNAVKAICARN